MRSFAISLLALTVWTPIMSADEFRCGTGPDTTARAATVTAWAVGRATSDVHALALPQPTSTADIVVLPADDTTAPYLREFDLGNSSLLFTPKDATSYTVTRGPVATDDRGTLLTQTGTATPLHLPFPVRIFEKSIQDVFISPQNAISGSPLPAPAFWQYDPLEILSFQVPVMAPLLTTPAIQSNTATIYIKTAPDAVTVTWVGDLEVRATLFADGRIRYSYGRGLSIIRGGSYVAPSSAVVLTSGNEPWRSTVAALGSSGPAAGGVDSSAPPDLAPMLDVVAASVGHVGGMDLIRTELTLGGAFDPAPLGSGGSVTYSVAFSSATFSRTVEARYANGRWTLAAPRPLRGFASQAEESQAVRVFGRSVVLDLTDDILGFQPTKVTITDSAVRANHGYAGDTLSVPLSSKPPTAHATTDFHTVAPGTALPVIAETFIRPTVNLMGVWDELQRSMGLSADAIDAVAVYQNFRTDIDFFASAYTLPGNSGADGTGRRLSHSSAPRFPSLMQMNDASVLLASAMPKHDATLLHEFGHRWLFYPSYKAGLLESRNMNPDGGHPAQYVDTRAAFRVETDHDCSVMGGAVFSGLSDGSFAIAPRSAEGYSWLELYLMGLAAPSEVASFFYLASTDPPLGISYWPPESITSVRGTKTEVTVDQVIASAGARVPAYPATPRTFTVVFVLLADPAYPVAANELAVVRAERDVLVRDFPVATGGRARVLAAPAPAPPRRRVVGH